MTLESCVFFVCRECDSSLIVPESDAAPVDDCPCCDDGTLVSRWRSELELDPAEVKRLLGYKTFSEFPVAERGP